MDPTESRDTYEILTERHRAGSIIVTSNRGPDEWLATFADPVRAQSAIDRFTSNAYDLVIEGESYRTRQKPTSGHAAPRTCEKGPHPEAMIAPLLFAAALDYTAEGGQPPSALPLKSKTLSITKRKRGEEAIDTGKR